MRLFVKSVTVALIVALIAGAAYAQFAKPDDAIRYRKAVMTLIVYHFQQMGAVIKGKADYDRAAFEDHAKVVHILSTMPWEAFMTAGSDQGDTTLKSSALKNKDAFMRAAKTFEDATKDLMLAASSGNLGPIKTEFGNVAGNCGSCHKQFRK